MARSDDRLNLDSKYINQSQIVLTQSESEIELTEYLIQSDGNGISQDSVPEVDFAPLLSQSAGSHGFNSTGFAEESMSPNSGPKTSAKEGWRRLKRYLLSSGPAVSTGTSTKLRDQPSHQGRLDGWRFSSLVSLVVTGTCLLLNIIFLTYVSFRYPAADWIGAIGIQGGCSAVKSWDSSLHIVLNVLGTALIAASNYNMQCLTSPTRLDVDAAHKKGKWLEIGIPSTKNLRFVPARQVILWWCLIFSSLPLHVLWNSAIFSTLQWNDYSVLVVSDNFLGDDKVMEDFNCSSANVQQYRMSDDEQNFVVCEMYSAARNQSKALKKMEPVDCMKAYSNALENTASNVLAVTAPRSPQTPSRSFPAAGNTSSILAYFNANSFPVQLGQWCGGLCSNWCQGNNCSKWCYDNPWNSSAAPQSCKEWMVNGTSYNPDSGQASDWICDPDHTFLSGCRAGDALSNQTNWTILPEHYKIDYCLSLSVPATCKLQYSFIILLVVIICNVVKLTAIAFTLVSVKGPIFATVGDSVASFLTNPDQTTVGQCLVGKEDLDLGSEKPLDEHLTEETTGERNAMGLGESRPLKWEQHAACAKRWYRAPTATRWAGCLCLWMCSICITGILLILSFSRLGISSLATLGFGAMNTKSLLTISSFRGGSSAALLATSVLANTPQLFLSGLYFMYNALYTSMTSANEWSRYASTRKALRVTSPTGPHQRGTYWLQLPWKFSLPLLISSSVMHWLVSQSIFLVNLKINLPTNQPLNEATIGKHPEFLVASTDGTITACGYSNFAIVCTIGVGILMVAALIVTSAFKLQPGIPLAGNCSWAISAACHPPAGDRDAALKPVQWGAVSHGSEEGGPGHCCFTSLEVERPELGRLYAGLRLKIGQEVRRGQARGLIAVERGPKPTAFCRFFTAR